MGEQTEATQHHGHLIFQWKRAGWTRRRLLLALLLAAALHGGMFYLFRVVNPAIVRTAPPRQTVLHLASDQPETKALVSAAEDRFPGMWRREAGASWERDVAALAKVVPSAFGAEQRPMAELKPFPLPLLPQALPPGVQAGSPLLPAVAAPAVAAVPVAAPAAGAATDEEPELPRPVPSLVVESGLGSREVLRMPSWPDDLVGEAWPETAAVPCMLGVDAAGRVAFCLPVTPASGVDYGKLRDVLVAMRFSTEPGAGIQWVMVSVRW